jgi:hypothetical protein
VAVLGALSFALEVPDLDAGVKFYTDAGLVGRVEGEVARLRCEGQERDSIIYDGQPERFRHACETYQAEAAKVGINRKLGHGIAPLRKIYLGNSFEEAFDLAVATGGYWFNNYFSLWGINEQSRIPSDDPNKMVTFASDRECAQRMYDQGQMLCGTPDDVSRQLEALQRCHGDDGDVEYLIWEYWVAPNTPADQQLDQLHTFMDKVWPRFK